MLYRSIVIVHVLQYRKLVTNACKCPVCLFSISNIVIYVSNRYNINKEWVSVLRSVSHYSHDDRLYYSLSQTVYNLYFVQYCMFVWFRRIFVLYNAVLTKISTAWLHVNNNERKAKNIMSVAMYIVSIFFQMSCILSGIIYILL